MLKPGDKIYLYRETGAVVEGWATFHCRKREVRVQPPVEPPIKYTDHFFRAPCGDIYSVGELLYELNYKNIEAMRYARDYLCMFEQLVATREMPGVE